MGVGACTLDGVALRYTSKIGAFLATCQALEPHGLGGAHHHDDAALCRHARGDGPPGHLVECRFVLDVPGVHRALEGIGPPPWTDNSGLVSAFGPSVECSCVVVHLGLARHSRIPALEFVGGLAKCWNECGCRAGAVDILRFQPVNPWSFPCNFRGTPCAKHSQPYDGNGP